MNQIMRMPQAGPAQSGWFWDGCQWFCIGDPDCPPPPCPPVNPAPPVPCPPFGPPVFSGPTGQPPWYPGANGGVSFGQNPPANPTRGHFWFDGATLWLFDGAAWVGVMMSSATSSPGNGALPPVTVTSGPTPPINPQTGTLWFNGTTLFTWDGKAWIPSTQYKIFLQAAQPSNPLPGDQWFDGTVLKMFDGTSWVLIGPQALPPPVTPITPTTIEFAMTATSGRPLPAGNAWGIVPFVDSPQLDLMSGWDPAGHKWTPNKAGVYIFLIRGGNGSPTSNIALLKNDPGSFTNVGNSTDIVVAISSESTAGWNSATGLAQMNGTGDYVRFWAAASDGTFHITGSNPCFTAALMP